jgi:hypothetical protein
MTTLSWPLVRIRIERLVIGSGMSALAWLLDRLIMRSTRHREKAGDEH